MIISRTPFRISFFGGGTDYPNYYLKNGGKSIGVTINKYCYLNVRELPPFFDYKHRIVYSRQELVNSFDEIQHPSVRETLKYFNLPFGVSIHHDGDIPARSGMGSSSAFTVGLVNALHALKREHISKLKLAKEAIHIEQALIKENVGSQDQILTTYGGLNLVNFLQNGEFSVEPIVMNYKKLKTFEQNILLFFSGVSRTSSDITIEQIKRTTVNDKNLEYMKLLVDEAYDILINPNRNMNEFGELLNKTWELKKTLSPEITNERIDKIYDKALKAGAIGGKLLGAGGGGFLAFYCEPHLQNRVINALKDYLYVPCNFDFDGSKIIVYEPHFNISDGV